MSYRVTGICSSCNKERYIPARGLCQTCYAKALSNGNRARSKKYKYPMKCLNCETIIHKRANFGLCMGCWLRQNRRGTLKRIRAKAGCGTLFDGYRLLSDHGSRKNPNRILEHRLVMEQHIGRKLRRDEIVHHKDRNRLNNSVSNLQIMSQSDHMRLHFPHGCNPSRRVK